VSCGLRDVVEFEGAGKPAVLIASDAFVEAAADQAAKLGQPELRRAFVAHPIQDRTDDELRALAAESVEQALAALTA
jgi:hypothetical protein